MTTYNEKLMLTLSRRRKKGAEGRKTNDNNLRIICFMNLIPNIHQQLFIFSPKPSKKSILQQHLSLGMQGMHCFRFIDKYQYSYYGSGNELSSSKFLETKINVNLYTGL